VIGLEADAALASQARANLRKAGVNNAEIVQTDGTSGLASQGPFDAILLCGSLAEAPQALLDQLKVGGRLLAILGQEPVMQATLFTRVAASQFSRQELFDTVAARLPGFAEPSRFKF
jgi:protein-L-isoaspartate(D-aspartate) O-methyltransferase